MDCDVRVIAEAKGEFACERRIELNAVQPRAAWGKQPGNCAVAGADFNYRALGDIAERVCDANARGFIDEKVLAELGLLCHHFDGSCYRVTLRW